jgi:hypothetical protein
MALGKTAFEVFRLDLRRIADYAFPVVIEGLLSSNRSIDPP